MSDLGCRQAVRQWVLVSSVGGSSPSTPVLSLDGEKVNTINSKLIIFYDMEVRFLFKAKKNLNFLSRMPGIGIEPITWGFSNPHSNRLSYPSLSKY